MSAGDTIPATPEQRIAELEAMLARQEEEIGLLRLELDLLPTIDVLTGLATVTGMIEIIDKALARQERAGEPFALMSVEVGALDDVERRFGRGARVETTRHIGAVLAGGLRHLDSIGRAEDDRFIATLPMLDAEGVDTIVERVEEMLALSSVQFDDEHVRLEPKVAILLVDGRPTGDPIALLGRLRLLGGEARAGKPAIATAR